MINLNIKYYNRVLILTILLGVSYLMAVEPYEIEKKSKEYYIKKNQKSPKIDGVLDVLEWSGIIPITDFLQKDPDNLKLPTEKNQLWE